jgi:F0F1-type ATP synthase delta subunit
MHETYAQALWKMIEAGQKPKDAVAKLRASLQVQGREALLPKIAHAFARIAKRFEAENLFTLSIAREKDERKAHSAAKDAIAELGVETKEIATKIDDSLIGGWRLEGRGYLVDASFKKYLIDMYNAATSATSTRT